MSDYTKQRISQVNHGETVEFEGQLLCEDRYEYWVRVQRDEEECFVAHQQIWQTRGGNLVAVITKGPENGSGHQDTKIKVVEVAGDEPSIDERCAVMELFDWRDRARVMVRRQLKWKLVRKVD